jgi:hypothetical protein
MKQSASCSRAKCSGTSKDRSIAKSSKVK